MPKNNLKDRLHRSKEAIKDAPTTASLGFRRKVNALVDKQVFQISPVMRSSPEHWICFDFESTEMVMPEPFLRIIAFEILKHLYPEDDGAVQPITVKCIVATNTAGSVPLGKMAIGKSRLWKKHEHQYVSDHVMPSHTQWLRPHGPEDFNHNTDGIFVFTADYTMASLEIANPTNSESSEGFVVTLPRPAHTNRGGVRPSDTQRSLDTW